MRFSSGWISGVGDFERVRSGGDSDAQIGGDEKAEEPPVWIVVFDVRREEGVGKGV